MLTVENEMLRLDSGFYAIEWFVVPYGNVTDVRTDNHIVSMPTSWYAVMLRQLSMG